MLRDLVQKKSQLHSAYTLLAENTNLISKIWTSTYVLFFFLDLPPVLFDLPQLRLVRDFGLVALVPEGLEGGQVGLGAAHDQIQASRIRRARLVVADLAYDLHGQVAGLPDVFRVPQVDPGETGGERLDVGREDASLHNRDRRYQKFRFDTDTDTFSGFGSIPRLILILKVGLNRDRY